MYRTIHSMMALSRMLNTADARAKIQKRAIKTGQKANRLRNEYTNNKIKQRQYTGRLTRTKRR